MCCNQRVAAIHLWSTLFATFCDLSSVKALAMSVTNKLLLAFWTLLCVYVRPSEFFALFGFVSFGSVLMWTMCSATLMHVHDAMLLLYGIKFIKYYICASPGFLIRASLIYSFNFMFAPLPMFSVLACFDVNVWLVWTSTKLRWRMKGACV